MKYFTYGRKLVDGVFYGPEGFLPTNSTSSVFYNANWFASADMSSLDQVWYFDPTEITKEYFDEAFAAQPPSGSIIYGN
jgi:hypothetical protein